MRYVCTKKCFYRGRLWKPGEGLTSTGEPCEMLTKNFRQMGPDATDKEKEAADEVARTLAQAEAKLNTSLSQEAKTFHDMNKQRAAEAKASGVSVNDTDEDIFN